MFKEITIYSGPGTDQESLSQMIRSLQTELPLKKYLIRKIGAREVALGGWRKSTEVFVIPGGRDLFYLRDLQGEAAVQISQFVEEGGVYLGICAGAYFAASAIEFEKGEPHQILGKRPLQFFPGIARGPAYGNNKYAVDSHRGVEAALISWEQSFCRVYFNGGCFFPSAESFSTVTVLSRYVEVESEPAAIILCTVGKGKAVLSGVHPEYSLPHLTPSKDPYLKQIFPQLKKDEPFRRNLFRTLLHVVLNNPCS